MKTIGLSAYNVHARVTPPLIALTPGVVSVIAVNPEFLDAGHLLLPAVAVSGLIFLLVHYARTRGKLVEKKLLESWKVFPSVRFLRHSDNTISDLTKKRYHQFISRNVPELILPSPEDEEANPAAADDIYKSANDWLRAVTRSSEQFSLLNYEIASYGFRRNMMGLKAWGLFFSVLGIIVNFFYIYNYMYGYYLQVDRINLSAPSVISLAFFLSLFSAVYWIAVVRLEWVEATANEYAKRLLESCDILGERYVN